MRGDDSWDCPLCHRRVRVNVDGRLKKHKRQAGWNGPDGEWCPNRSPWPEKIRK